MSNEIKGNIEYVGETTRFSDKFVARDLVLEVRDEHNGTEYVNYIKLQLVNDRCDLVNGLELGDEVRVGFYFRGRKVHQEGEVKYYTNLNAWKIEKV